MNLHLRRIAVAPVAWFSLLLGFFHGLIFLVAAIVFERQVNSGLATVARQLGLPLAPVNFEDTYIVIALIALPLAYLITGAAAAGLFNLVGGFRLEKEDQDLLEVLEQVATADGQLVNCAWCGVSNRVPTGRRLFHCRECGEGSIINDDGSILKLE